MAEIPPGDDPVSLIRQEGKEMFEKRIAAARNFFDYWLDHKVANVDPSSLRAKMQLARELAQTVSHVHEPMMRGQVVNQVSVRLGVPASEFEALLPKKPPGRPSDSEQLPKPSAPPPPHDVAMLCLLALRDDAARNFLLQQSWHEILEQTPGAELLVRILETNLWPEDAGSMNAFMARLSADEERLVSRWLLQKVPENPLAVAEDWWNGLRPAVLRRQLQIAEGQLKLPQLSTGELLNLQKQILDLRQQLHEFLPFSSARPGDKRLSI